mmetsp:Transcript_97478/g.244306  ORF Transcript_97478/g.244306 Transcript_97478/m.244306 type:complete len:88 (-) Transcript_97478:338-601(-)
MPMWCVCKRQVVAWSRMLHTLWGCSTRRVLRFLVVTQSQPYHEGVQNKEVERVVILLQSTYRLKPVGLFAFLLAIANWSTIHMALMF